MLRTYRRQMFLTLIVFVICLFTLIAFVTLRMVETHQISTIRDALVREANSISLLLVQQEQQANVISERMIALVDELRKSSGARVTMIDQSGRVLADSHADAARMDNHAQRPEIVGAKTRAYGTDIRTSRTIAEQTLYVAIQMQSDQGVLGYLRLSNSLAEVDATTNQLIRFLLGMLLLLFVFSALVSWRIARSLSQPIHELRGVARQITLGNYAQRVTYLRNNELGQLGASINNMADSLAQQMKHITESEHRLRNVLDHLHVGVVLTNYDGIILIHNPFIERFQQMPSARSSEGHTLDELALPHEFLQSWQQVLRERRAERCELRLYYPEERMIDVEFIPLESGMMITFHDLTSIRRLEHMRSEFVANVSHELRTPLAAIRGFAETLKLGAMTQPETADSFLQVIIDESDRLNRLVNDLLDLAKIETRRLPLLLEPVAVQSLVVELAKLLKQALTQKELVLALTGPADVIVEADLDRLRQIFLNLLYNSIQYTPQGGTIYVQWHMDEHDQQQFVISVRDTGIGIPAEDVPHVFERFFRVARDRNRQSGGTGLGLAITKHLVELHKGNIHVESQLGEGSCFTVTLPRKQ